MSRPPLRADGPSTSERILDAAEVAFAAHGFEGAKLAEIAKVVGIRRPSLLYHFASKELLYTAVVERAFADLQAEITRALGEAGSYEARLEGLAERYETFLRERESFAPLIVRELIDGRGTVRARVLELLPPLLDGLEAFLAQSERAPADLPWRAALLQLATGALLRRAMGEAGDALWGVESALPSLARRLLVADEDD